MVQVSEQASYDLDSVKSISFSNKTSEFHQVTTNVKTRRSKFVATCYCSRRPGIFFFFLFDRSNLIF